MLSRCEENVLERDEGMREKRRDLVVSPEPELLVFRLEKPKEVRRLDSVLCRGAEMVSLDIGPAMDVRG